MLASATDIVNRYNVWNSAKVKRSIDPYSGAITTNNNRVLAVTAGATDAKHTYYIADAGTGANPKGDVTGSQAARLFTLINGLIFHLHDHLQAKNHVAWRWMYHHGMRNFDHQQPNGAIVQTSLASYPCHYCGVVLPEDVIQVDHRQPQAAAPGYAVAKVFHSIELPTIDLTVRAATGAKNIQGMAIARGQGVYQVPTKGWARAQGWQSRALNQHKRERYTLSDEGKTFLTLATMVHGVGYMESACINSILNLVPACPLCNRSKTNVVHAYK